MRVNSLSRGIYTTWLTAVIMLASLGTAHGQTSGFGRISGLVADSQGMPLMGATVQIIGPMLNSVPGGAQLVEKILTDAHGRFMAERLLPGRYSLQVTSATRLPVFRKGILVNPGQSVEQSFVLGEILAPIRLQVPAGNVTTWGDDWKWVLRTSAATRPILRFQQQPQGKSKKKNPRPVQPESERLIAVNSGASRGQALTSDPGMGSIIAYQRSLSDSSDLLVAGSLATGSQVTSVATVLRREFARDNPQELAVAVHKLNAADSFALGSGPQTGESASAQAISTNYSQTRRVLRKLILTAGFDLDYLYAGHSTASARPYLKTEYELNQTSSIVVRHGSARVDGSQSLLDRVDALGAFPRITLQGYQPRLERMIHSEAAYKRQLGRNTRLEAAAYHDNFQNAALWGFGNETALAGLSGNYFANPAANGVTLYAGHYSTSGVRTALVRNLGSSTEVSVLYAVGDALMADAKGIPINDPVRALQSSLRTRQTQSVGGRVSTRIPRSRTIVTTSYLWIPADRLSSVDPVGQASYQIQPYLGVQIRQPLPSLAFLPARIEATADFRNLLSQGYVPVRGTGQDPLLITPAYRCIRGGFSVQF